METKILQYSKFSGLIFFLICSCIQNAEPETFLIPKDFRGRANIIYDQKCGLDEEYENGRRVYRIPEDGVLLTKFSKPSGFIDHKYYLVDKTGNRIELSKMDVRDYNEDYTISKNPKEPPRDTLGVFKWGTLGSAAQMSDDGYTFQEFFVSDYNNLGKNYTKKYLSFTDLIKEKRKNCN
ncbi:hypothetical protein ML462_15325 [Gramella lutea]|uniref:DUF6843 domain-containing protein n=1 Tax=Christiangramia lutea TaxID=1607951 RepID=A0A9X1V8U7_9FLAO|nr:hypothetical protein [Christiangramia lutea]MCH4824543.1 hypothetical protein [Christiangramia lutea]